ncbi:MAG: permease [Alphaproteobacteria bacterium]
MNAIAVRLRTLPAWAKFDRAWLATGLILAALFIFVPAQGWTSLHFAAGNLMETAPYLLLSIGIAAYAGATGADNLIARVFTGNPVSMIFLAAAFGGLSPFCSCGVIPLIAALLAMGVPLAPVMAFWLASPVIDPSSFVLTAGVLGMDFAVAKTITAIALGLFGGFGVYVLAKAGRLVDPLREGVGNGSCGGAAVRAPKPVVWKFWRDEARVSRFGRDALKTTLFLGKWLTLAFVLESLMLAYVPAEWITQALGGNGIGPVATATIVGIPAYLNGYAALPLVSGLIEQGMLPGAGMAFLVAGGVTSIPAAIAVFALVKKPVFALYIAFALSGSFASGLLYQLWLA